MTLSITAFTFLIVGATFRLNAQTARIQERPTRGLTIASWVMFALFPACIALAILIVTGVIE